MAAAEQYVKAEPKPGELLPFLEEIRSDIDDAVNYFRSEVSDEIEKGLRYYNGEVDLPVSEGRSQVVSTQVRDAIRNMKPSIMRVLCGTTSIVKYVPSNVAVAAVIEQQDAYVHQRFWASGGYKLLLAAVDESLKCKMCPIKTYWVPNVPPTFQSLTMLTQEEVLTLEGLPDVEILDIFESDNSPISGIDFFDVELEQVHHNGKAVMEAIPVNEFFISRNATGVEDARVHGHQRNVTVSEAIELNLDYEDWWGLDAGGLNLVNDLRTDRKLARVEKESERGDVLSHQFLLTEAYIQIDLLDAGSNQLYCVYFGGTNYEYLGHYRETESPFDLMIPDPIAFSVYGNSPADVLVSQQDTTTSLLRGTVDNVHAANRPRIAGDPQKVNFDDLMHHEIDYPIRMKMGATLQVITVPSQLQGSLPLLQWLENESQQKIGITKAAQGLDPDALQSTDKDAVRNTIMLAQGQVELMVRNIVETAIIPIFRKLLRLSIQHLDRFQIIKMQGQLVQVDQLLFDPNLYCETQVGLGTKGDDQRGMGLTFTLEKQFFVLERLGMDNPFVSSAHIYNTLEDMTKLFGLHNVGRYWNLVTPEMEKQYKQQKEQEAAMASQQNKAKDPGTAMVESESIKAGVEKFKIVAQHRAELVREQFKALEANARDDLERDKMAQDLALKSGDLLGKYGTKLDENAIKREQNAQRSAIIPLNRGNEANPEGAVATPARPMIRPMSPRPMTPA